MVRECQQPPKVWRQAWKRLPRASRGPTLPTHWLQTSSLQNSPVREYFLLFWDVQSVVFCYGSPRKLILKQTLNFIRRLWGSSQNQEINENLWKHRAQTTRHIVSPLPLKGSGRMFSSLFNAPGYLLHDWCECHSTQHPRPRRLCSPDICKRSTSKKFHF